MLQGQKLPFAEEAQGLFGVRPDLQPLSSFDPVLARIDRLVPGEAPLWQRVEAFQNRFTIPEDRLKPVFDAAIAECKRRTAEHISLPPGERFTMEFVTGKSWSGYNYYQGDYRSLIQINTDLPIRISRAVDPAFEIIAGAPSSWFKNISSYPGSAPSNRSISSTITEAM